MKAHDSSSVGKPVPAKQIRKGIILVLTQTILLTQTLLAETAVFSVEKQSGLAISVRRLGTQ